MKDYEARMRILEMIESGAIRPDQGAQLLDALQGEPDTDEVDNMLEAEPEPDEEAAAERKAEPLQVNQGRQETTQATEERPQKIPSDFQKWQRWWTIPLWIGIGITSASAWLLYQGLQASWATFWLACIWLPLLLGVAVIVMAWLSRSARWLHVRVHQKPGEWPKRISISFPIPIRTAAWFLRRFGHLIPGMDATGLDEVILALADSTNLETPLYIEVDEGELGERVEVFIG